MTEAHEGDSPALADMLRTWRNHWAEVERVTADFPEDIRRALVVRPTDPTEALQQAVPQFAVLFHPHVQQALVDQFSSALEIIERLIDGQA